MAPLASRLVDADVLDLLAALVEKSLVIVSGGRYRLLESVRQYGAETLSADQQAALQIRHRDYILGWMESTRRMGAENESAMVACMEIEHENLRAALECCRRQEHRGMPYLRLAGAAWRFWQLRGHLSEGRSFLEDSLGRTARSRGAERADALRGAGVLALRQGDVAAARNLLEESLALWRELKDDRGLASSLNDLGLLAYEVGDSELALHLYEESLAIWRMLSDGKNIALLLNNLSLAHTSLDNDVPARAFGEEALELSRAGGYRHIMGLSLGTLGLLAVSKKEWLVARAYFEECLQVFREESDRFGIAANLQNLADVEHRLDDPVAARAHLAECLHLARELGANHIVPEALETLARLNLSAGMMRQAARLLWAAESLRENLGRSADANRRDEADEMKARIRANITEDAFRSAVEFGRSMTSRQAIDYALSTLSAPQDT